MRIGIDLDDTICDTTEIVHEKLEEYSETLNINPLDIMNDEELKINFFNIYLEDIYSNVRIKSGAGEVIRKLHNLGNTIIFITARSNGLHDVVSITKKWLEDNDIIYDMLVTSCYGETKASACKEQSVDLMIDDDPFNYKQIGLVGIKCLLFDDRGRYELKGNYVTNWMDVLKYIEEMR